MVINEDSDLFKYRVAHALNILLARNKKKHQQNKKRGIEDLLLDYSFDKISSRTGLRVATISAVFNGKVDAKFSTIAQILHSLGVTYSQFGRLLESINDDDLEQYYKRSFEP